MQIPKFESEQAKKLQQLCADYENYTQPYYFIHGQLFAVAAAPEIPMPDQWIPWTLKRQDLPVTPEQAEELTLLLMSLFQLHLRNMRDEQLALPDFCQFPQDYNIDSPLSLWFQGLLSVHQQLETVWQQGWDKLQQQHGDMLDTSRELKHVLSMFSTFANIPLALEKLTPEAAEKLEQKLPAIFEALPSAFTSYVDIAGKLAGFLPDQFETFSKPED